MKIDLDDKWCITSSNHCNVILVKKSGRLQKDGTPAGQKFYYQNFGQAVKDWIQMAGVIEDINSFQELANFIDGKLKAVELKIDQQMEGYEHE